MKDLLLLLVFPTIIIYSAVSDLLRMTISNRVSLGLAAAFVAMALFTGMSPAEAGWHLAAAFSVLVVAFACFAFGWIGGGDGAVARLRPSDRLSHRRIVLRRHPDHRPSQAQDAAAAAICGPAGLDRPPARYEDRHPLRHRFGHWCPGNLSSDQLDAGRRHMNQPITTFGYDPLTMN